MEMVGDVGVGAGAKAEAEVEAGAMAVMAEETRRTLRVVCCFHVWRARDRAARVSRRAW